MKQPINEIKRMQQLAGIINEETINTGEKESNYTENEITDALKRLSINPYHTIGDETAKDWALTIDDEEKVWRFEKSDINAIIKKIEGSDKKELSKATLGIVDTRPKKKSSSLAECDDCDREGTSWVHGQDHEASMADSELRDLISNASKLQNMIEPGDELPGWASAYITLAADYMHSVAEYMEGKSAEMGTDTSNNMPQY
jgi:hypothetical protein